ncbi:MAG: hypothetical protein GTN64_08545 [Candidatus Latescibacteria bacterium]|nr:hypothetical protein [Candidatus Latescibacterota bacterium]NIO78647.1 hypothetical protein [Candidatus Latescibacterota bacterium]
MVNILAGRRVVPELVQGQLTVANLARELGVYFTNEDSRLRVRGELAQVCGMLGQPGASERVADTIRLWNMSQL